MKNIKISDLKIGNEYYVCFTDDARMARKCKLLSVNIQELNESELEIEFSDGINLVFCNEIGIGATKMEAKANYQKLL